MLLICLFPPRPLEIRVTLRVLPPRLSARVLVSALARLWPLRRLWPLPRVYRFRPRYAVGTCPLGRPPLGLREPRPWLLLLPLLLHSLLLLAAEVSPRLCILRQT